MRDVKFRGISALTGEFVYGSYVKTDTVKTGAVIVSTEGFCVTEVKPETVGQFTGSKDKNGVEIYEDDITFYSEAKLFASVYYSTSSSQFRVSWVEDGFTYNEDLIECEYWFEIAGNIHKNPELVGK